MLNARDLVQHVASQETPGRSIDALVRGVVDAHSGVQSKRDLSTIAADLVANIPSLIAAVTHQPNGTAPAPVGVAPPVAPAPGPVTDAQKRQLKPGVRPDDVPPADYVNGGPGVSVLPFDIPAMAAEIERLFAELKLRMQQAMGILDKVAPLPAAPDSSAPTPAEPVNPASLSPSMDHVTAQPQPNGPV